MRTFGQDALSSWKLNKNDSYDLLNYLFHDLTIRKMHIDTIFGQRLV